MHAHGTARSGPHARQYAADIRAHQIQPEAATRYYDTVAQAKADDIR